MILAPRFLAFEHRVSDQRVTFGCVRADDQEAIGIRLEFRDRIRHGATPKGCGQTGHSGSVSETGAVIDVIRADHRAGELLQEVVFFVGALG